MPRSDESHPTRLVSITPKGEILLETDDPAVMHKARSAGEAIKSFVYETAKGEEIVNGRVTQMNEPPGGPCRFAVLAEEAGLGP